MYLKEYKQCKVNGGIAKVKKFGNESDGLERVTDGEEEKKKDGGA